MGVQNRQRRAAKQKQARRSQQQPPRERRERAEHVDERTLAASVVWSTAQAIADGDAEETDALLEILDAAPAAVDVALSDALSQQAMQLQRHGWDDDDIREVEARRLRAPSGASERERGVRLLVLLVSLPSLPPVEVRRRATSDVDEGMLSKIRALLAKAESTTFPDEAEALSAKAQELMARHRIDHALVDDGAGAAGDQPVGRRIWLDDPYSDAKARLLAEVAAANRCRSVQLSGIGCAHVVGYPVDLDVVELMHTSLLVQATSAMAAAGPQRDRRGRSRTRSFRQSFLIAYASRIGDRLAEVASAVEHEVTTTGVDLLPVLARREDAVDDALARAFPKLAHKRVSITNEAGWLAGTMAADVADLGVGPAVES